MHVDKQVTFVPRPPPPRDFTGSPIGKRHIRGAKISPVVEQLNYDGEQDMLKVIDIIRKQPAGYFLYLTHTYSKNSNDYNFYNVK